MVLFYLPIQNLKATSNFPTVLLYEYQAIHKLISIHVLAKSQSLYPLLLLSQLRNHYTKRENAADYARIVIHADDDAIEHGDCRHSYPSLQG